MNIFEFADIIGKELIVRRMPNQNNRWMCDFDRCEVKEGIMLGSVFGNARNPIDSINNFTQKIRGQKLIFNAYTDKRQEFNAPNDLKGYQI